MPVNKKKGQRLGDELAPAAKVTPELLLEIYQRLYQRYGPQRWWPAETTLEIALGAILTQAVSWSNVEKALVALKRENLISTRALRDISQDELAVLIRPVGYFNSKARKLKAFIHHVWDGYGGDLELFLAQDSHQLREELLSIHGIGEETADDIVLYAAGRPSFVIDAYTRRIMTRMGLAPATDKYRAHQELFHANLPPDVPLFNEYHALLDRHAKDTCKKLPLCRDCSLLDLCPSGKLGSGSV